MSSLINIEEIDDAIHTATSNLVAGNKSQDSRALATISQLGYAPPELMSAEKHPELRDIIASPMSKAFLFSIDKTLNTLSLTVLGILAARMKLDDCLELNGRSEASSQVAHIARSVQTCLDVFSKKSSQSVLNMATIARTMAAARTLIKYDADPLAVANNMRECTVQLSEQNKDGELEGALEKINDAIAWIYENLPRETAIEERKIIVAERMEVFEVKRDEYRVAQDQWFDRRSVLIANKSCWEDEKRFVEACMANLDRYLSECSGQIAHLLQMVRHMDENIRRSYDAQRNEVAVLTSGQQDMIAMVNDFNRASTRDLDRQVDATARRIRNLDENMVELSQKEANADPGGTFTTTHTSSKKVLWWKVASSSSTTTVTRPNQQIKYTRLLEGKRRERDQMQRQMESIRRQRESVLDKTMQKFNEVNARAEKDKRAVDSRYNQKRIEMNHCKNLLMLQQKQMVEQRERIMGQQTIMAAKRAELAGKLGGNAIELERLESEREGLKQLKSIMDAAYSDWSNGCRDLEEQLEQASQILGQTGKTFVKYIRAMRSLQQHSRNLPIMFRQMETAFKSIELSMQCDGFLAQMKLIPEDRRKDALTELTENFGLVAQIGQTFLDQPVQALVKGNLCQLMESERQTSFVELPRTCTIEEVEE